MKRNLQRLEQAREVISFGKLSGAVGTFANVSPGIEAYVCKRLGLKPAEVSTQILQRDRHAQYFTALAILAGTLEKVAVEIRHLQRTEVLEAEEPFEKGQKGSSAMPHKKNPIGCENVAGLARLVRSNALAAMENMALWHERDISHSSVERVSARTEIIDHGFIHSLYSFDPNGIPIEFSCNVPARDVRKEPRMIDSAPSAVTSEGPDPQPDRWPLPTTRTPVEERKVHPGAGSELFHGRK